MTVDLESLLFPILIVLALLLPLFRRREEARRRAAWREQRASLRPRRGVDQPDEPPEETRMQGNGRPPEELDEI